MSMLVIDAKKLGGLAGHASSGVETGPGKKRSLPSKLESARRSSELLTAQWRARRKSILLNPKGLPRLTVAKLIQGGRK